MNRDGLYQSAYKRQMRIGKAIILTAAIFTVVCMWSVLRGQEIRSKSRTDEYTYSAFKKEIRRIEGLLSDEGAKALERQLASLLQSASGTEILNPGDDGYNGLIARLKPMSVWIEPNKFAYLQFDVAKLSTDQNLCVAVHYIPDDTEEKPYLDEEFVNFKNFGKRITENLWFYSRSEPGT